jgi:hypothetical protein
METLKYTDLTDLPSAVGLMTAARALGLGRIKAYELTRQGQLPCRIIKIGDTYRVPTPELLRLPGAVPDHGTQAEVTAVPPQTPARPSRSGPDRRPQPEKRTVDATRCHRISRTNRGRTQKSHDHKSRDHGSDLQLLL